MGPSHRVRKPARPTPPPLRRGSGRPLRGAPAPRALLWRPRPLSGPPSSGHARRPQPPAGRRLSEGDSRGAPGPRTPPPPPAPPHPGVECGAGGAGFLTGLQNMARLVPARPPPLLEAPSPGGGSAWAAGAFDRLRLRHRLLTTTTTWRHQRHTERSRRRAGPRAGTRAHAPPSAGGRSKGAWPGAVGTPRWWAGLQISRTPAAGTLQLEKRETESANGRGSQPLREASFPSSTARGKAMLEQCSIFHL